VKTSKVYFSQWLIW